MREKILYAKIKIKQHYKIVGFLVSFAAILLCMFSNWDIRYYGDSLGYYQMATEFINQGLGNFRFDLAEGGMKTLFELRGYAWPFLIAVLRVLGFNTKTGWLIWESAFMCFGLSWAVPEFFETLFRKKGGIISRIILPAFTLIFWKGAIIYPLSDIPAITFVTLGMLILLKAFGHNGIRKTAEIFAGGVCLGLSYYIRTGSMVSIFCAVLILLIYNKTRPVKRLLAVVIFAAGIMLTMIPQVIINVECNETFSWQVPISFTTGITDLEYYNGVRYLRWETNVSETHPDTVLLSEDSMAGTLLEQQNLIPEEIGPKELLVSILKYPVEFLGIFTSKFANMIDARWGESYIQELKGIRYGIIILNFTIWFLGIAGIIFELGRARNGISKKSNEITNLIYFLKKYFLYILACASPALLHLLGTHVEPRYFLPVTVILWQYMAVLCPWRELVRFLYNRVISMAAIYVVLFGCCCAIWNFTIENMPFYSYIYQAEPQIIDASSEEVKEIFDSEGVVGCINRYALSDEKKIGISGYAFTEGKNSEDTEMAIAFISEDKTYFYEINNTKGGDLLETYGENYYEAAFNFDAYLWDLDKGEYSVYILLENGESKNGYDTLYKIYILE